jgi:prepilin-type N-terminal cleavage/methylation domain-containing protein
MQTQTNNQYRAFTMIELLVVVAIFGITASVLLVDASGSRNRQYLDAAGREVEAVIRGAQNAALAGVQVASADRPCGFRVDWGGSDYTVTYRYKDGSGSCTQSSLFSSHALSNGVVFNNAGTFVYTLPYAAIAAAQSIYLSRQSSFQAVCVYRDGRITTLAGNACP